MRQDWRFGQVFPAVLIEPTGAGGDHFDEKCFKGPLARITREALDYIRRNYLKETVVKHPDRAEAERFWNFPYPAIEEAVVNAVYHRSYEIREPIEVRITPEDLVVLSFPGPDRSIRMKDLRSGKAVSRRYRNRRIGEFLKELDLTEGRSTGIPKILKVMKKNGSPPPQFETDEDRSFFLIRLPVHLEVELEKTSEKTSGETSEKTSEKTPVKTSDRILHLLRDNPNMTLAEVSEIIEKSLRAVERASSKLVKAGRLKYVGPQKGGHWSVKEDV